MKGPKISISTIIRKTIFSNAREDYNFDSLKISQQSKRMPKQKRFLFVALGLVKYNRYSSVKLQKILGYQQSTHTTHERTSQVKKSKIVLLHSQYELFKMKEGEFLQEMFNRFSENTNELNSFGEVIPMSKRIEKLLDILPDS